MLLVLTILAEKVGKSLHKDQSTLNQHMLHLQKLQTWRIKLPTLIWASERQRLPHNPSPEVSVAWKDLIHLPSQLPRNSKGIA